MVLSYTAQSQKASGQQQQVFKQKCPHLSVGKNESGLHKFVVGSYIVGWNWFMEVDGSRFAVVKMLMAMVVSLAIYNRTETIRCLFP